MKSKENGAYIMVINGAVEIEGQKLQQRDAIGVWENENVSIKASENAEIIIIEVPMN